MQAPNDRYNFTLGQKPQSDAVFQRPLRHPGPYLGKGGMDIGGLLNARNAAAADAELRRQLHQSMQMDGGVAYAMNQGPAMGHHQQHPMQAPNGMPYGALGQAQHNPQLYAQNFIPRHGGQNHLADDNFGAMRPKNEGAPKAFACSTCQKGFARRSDLARHGEETFIRSKDCADIGRTDSQWHQASRLRLPRLRQTIHSTVCLDSPCESTHRREATHV